MTRAVRHRLLRPVLRAGALLLCVALSACAVGPDYQRPAIDVGMGYKEGQERVPGWKPAHPRDDVSRGLWWRVYGDDVLDGLMVQLNAANQDVAVAEANYRQAQALVQSSRAGFYPAVGASAGVTRSGAGNGGSGSGNSVGNQYALTGSVSWELDLWGRLRRDLESSRASAQASAADLAATRLSAQAALAQNYFQLRVLDEQKRLLDATTVAYERALQLNRNRYDAGVAGKADVAVATAQLENARVQSVDLDWQRGQLEHAIAVLTGQPPSRFALPPRDFAQQLPEIPVGLPSELLERRPDVAAAERRAAAANAQIGVAESAWFPDLVLSADGGFRNGSFADWLSAPARFWSLGPSLAMTLFDGGARQAQVDQARAAYDAQAAAYRQSVLTALREVEDYLVQLRVLAQEQVVQARALDASRESLRLIRNQYEEGLVDYLDVAAIQTTALSSERSALSLIGDRLVASVQLIAALGGGWDGLAPDGGQAATTAE
ncbi:efflux transporter outer membrane subunit [Bordetella genomosp. 13]|uniref:RND transporter n=1 Tax=Bordetella genomosp. 13 TaxID=463040 RepID=A0A1W6ZGX5_9BORD|nr:efflux transporter outer membrane subunit [Bordetella genomosp. 13]ARP96663.1 RND transporter [Bordetella genomosp. 13]